MAGNKCLYKKTEADYDEEDFFTSRCFQVGSDVQLKDVPSNGEEYLLTVMKERANYATISQCDFKKYKKLLKTFTSNQFEEITKPTVPETVKPTIEWQNIQVADFSDVRMYIQKMISKELLPAEIKNTETSKHRIKDWQPLFDEEEPTMTHVVGLSQSILDEGLDILTEKLDLINPGQTVDRKTGQWIYTLLAVTRYPHLQDTTTKLRALARKCLEIRSRINPENDNAKELAAPLNLFICLTARYFGQKDLAD